MELAKNVTVDYENGKVLVDDEEVPWLIGEDVYVWSDSEVSRVQVEIMVRGPVDIIRKEE